MDRHNRHQEQQQRLVQQNKEQEFDISQVQQLVAERIRQIDHNLIRQVSYDLQKVKPKSIYGVFEVNQFKSMYQMDDLRQEAAKLERSYQWHLGIRGDGNCFYRSIIILYIGKLFQSSELLLNFIRQVYSLNNIESSLTRRNILCEDLKVIFLGFLMFLYEEMKEGKVKNFQEIIYFYNQLPEVDMAAIAITRFLIYQQFDLMKNDPIRKFFIEDKMRKEGKDLILTYFESAEDIIISLAASALKCSINVQHFYRAIGDKRNQGIVNKLEKYQPHPNGINSNIHVTVLFLNGHYEALLGKSEEQFYQLKLFNEKLASTIVQDKVFFEIFTQTHQPRTSTKDLTLNKIPHQRAQSSSTRQTFGSLPIKILENQRPVMNQSSIFSNTRNSKNMNELESYQSQSKKIEGNQSIIKSQEQITSEAKDRIPSKPDYQEMEKQKFECDICRPNNQKAQQTVFTDQSFNFCKACADEFIPLIRKQKQNSNVNKLTQAQTLKDGSSRSQYVSFNNTQKMQQFLSNPANFSKGNNGQTANFSVTQNQLESSKHAPVKAQHDLENNTPRNNTATILLKRPEENQNERSIQQSCENQNKQYSTNSSENILFQKDDQNIQFFGLKQCGYCQINIDNIYYYLEGLKSEDKHGICHTCVQMKLILEPNLTEDKIILSSRVYTLSPDLKLYIQRIKQDQKKQLENQNKYREINKNSNKPLNDLNKNGKFEPVESDGKTKELNSKSFNKQSSDNEKRIPVRPKQNDEGQNSKNSNHTQINQRAMPNPFSKRSSSANPAERATNNTVYRSAVKK